MKAGRSIHDIFQNDGEEAFRKLENEVWEQIQSADIVSVGGGFNLDLIQIPWKVLWLRRDTDSWHRIFLDRPSLVDYPQRFQQREKKFSERAHFIYTVPEGLVNPDPHEKQILNEDFENLGGAVTTPHYSFPNTWVEIRDDLPSVNSNHSPYPETQVFFSVRTKETYPLNTRIDWDIKKPIPTGLQPFIISTHENDISVLRPYESSGSILKYCPLVSTWKELEKGLEWQSKDPLKRSFLPRSENGKWSWVRLWLKNHQPLNFWREGLGSSLDQPTLWEWISHPNNVKAFAAVLGSPILHSYSPTYHKTCFLLKGLPFYRIQIEESEWDEAIPILRKMGLVACAVTSPLKKKAGELVGSSPLNTLAWNGTQWIGHNTDPEGAQSLLMPFKSQVLVVWGGGGVIESLKGVIPEASYYSAQEAKPRIGSKEVEKPEVLVWADSHDSSQKLPPQWSPQVIVDLNYRDDSPGRAAAQKLKCQYVSGLAMFTTQAQAQQSFWSSFDLSSYGCQG